MTQREQLSGFFLSLLLARLQNLRFVALPGWAFFSEPRPKGENLLFSSEGTLDTLFPLEYWVVSWRTDAKGTDLRSRVASSSDRRDVGLPSRSVETPFREYTAASRHAQRQTLGHLGLDLLGLVGSRLVLASGALRLGMSRFLQRRLSAFGHPRFSWQRRLSAFGHPRFSCGRHLSAFRPSTFSLMASSVGLSAIHVSVVGVTCRPSAIHVSVVGVTCRPSAIHVSRLVCVIHLQTAPETL